MQLPCAAADLFCYSDLIIPPQKTSGFFSEEPSSTSELIKHTTTVYLCVCAYAMAVEESVTEPRQPHPEETHYNTQP